MVEEIKKYIIGVIVFTIFIVGGVSLLGYLNDADPTFSNSDLTQFNKSFNKLNDVTSSTSNLKSSVEEADPDLGFFGVLNALVSSAWNTLKLTFTSFSFMEDVFINGSNIFGIPNWISTLIVGIITTIICFAIYKAIFKVQ